MKRLAILNSESLIGTEVKEALGRRPDLECDVRLLTTAIDEVGVVTEGPRGAAFLQEFSTEALEDVELLICCPGSTAISSSDLPPGLTVVHLASAAPLPDGLPLVAGVNLDRAERGSKLVSPHPAVIALAHLLQPLRSFGLEEAACWCLLPSSTRGQEGLDELFGQTRAILSFSSERPETVFGAQLAFNLLPADVSGGELGLELGKILDLPAPPMHVLQAGIFHGVAAGAHVRLSRAPSLDELREELLADRFLSPADDPLAVGPVAAAGRSEAILAAVDQTPGRPDSYSLWMVMDNLTMGGAENVVAIVEALAGVRH